MTTKIIFGAGLIGCAFINALGEQPIAVAICSVGASIMFGWAADEWGRRYG